MKKKRRKGKPSDMVGTKEKATIAGRKLIWRKEWYVDVYRLASAGLSNRMISEHLGISTMTLLRKKKKDPALRKALTDGRSGDKAKNTTFKDYVHERLPKHLRGTWELIERCETEPHIVKRVEGLLADCGRRGRQHLFFNALVNYNFSITKACKAVNINRQTFDRWVLTDPGFADIMDEIHAAKKDFFEEQLVGLAMQGNAAAIIFGCKTVAADRGYENKKKVSHEHSGQVTHSHMAIPIEQILPDLEDRKKALERFRELKENPVQAPRVLPAHEEKDLT